MLVLTPELYRCPRTADETARGCHTPDMGWSGRLAAATFALVIAALPAGISRAGESAPPSTIEQTLDLAVPSPEGWQTVHISMLAINDASADMPARLAAGRAAMLARFPGAVELLPAELIAQFKLFGVRWPERFATWTYNPAGATTAMPPADAFAAIRAGSEGWKNAAKTGFHFDYLGETGTPTGCNGVPTQIPKDGQNVVGWGHIVGNYLGYSCYWSGPTLVEGTPYFALTEFDIVLEPNAAYSAQSLRALAMHEFGHSLGLDHTEQSLCPGQAMCAGDGALIFTSPQKDDLFGLVALYGVDPNAPPDIPPGPRPFRLVAFPVSRD
jgi:hypothetical protein